MRRVLRCHLVKVLILIKGLAAHSSALESLLLMAKEKGNGFDRSPSSLKVERFKCRACIAPTLTTRTVARLFVLSLCRKQNSGFNTRV